MLKEIDESKIKFTGNFGIHDWDKYIRTMLDYSPAKLVRTGSSDTSKGGFYNRSRENMCLFTDSNDVINEGLDELATKVKVK